MSDVCNEGSLNHSESLVLGSPNQGAGLGFVPEWSSGPVSKGAGIASIRECGSG